MQICELDAEQLDRHMIEGRFASLYSRDVWLVDREKLIELIKDVFNVDAEIAEDVDGEAILAAAAENNAAIQGELYSAALLYNEAKSITANCSSSLSSGTKSTISSLKSKLATAIRRESEVIVASKHGLMAIFHLPRLCRALADYRNHRLAIQPGTLGQRVVPRAQISQMRNAQAVGLQNIDTVGPAQRALLIIVPALNALDHHAGSQHGGAGMIHQRGVIFRLVHLAVIAVRVADRHRVAAYPAHGIAHMRVKGVGQDAIAVGQLQ